MSISIRNLNAVSRIGDLGAVSDWLGAAFFGRPMAERATISADVRDLKSTPEGLAIPQDWLDRPAPTPMRPARAIDLYLPVERFLSRHVDIPRSARRKASRIADLDLMRRTPFRTTEVYRALSPLSAGLDSHTTQWVVSVEDVAAIRANLASRGLRLRGLHVANEPGVPAIADFSTEIAPSSRTWQLVNIILLFLAAAFSVVAYAYPGWQAGQQTMSLETEIATLRRDAVDLRRDVERAQAQETEKAAFLDDILQGPRLADTLRALTVALPDEVWLSDLAYSRDRVVLVGQTAGSAAELVLAIGQDGGLGDPRLSGAVSRTAEGQERFEMTFALARR